MIFVIFWMLKFLFILMFQQCRSSYVAILRTVVFVIMHHVPWILLNDVTVKQELYTEVFCSRFG